ncbi:Putative transcriptional regulator%2C TetR [Mycobacteroides abscessus]|uniref:Transcriptional regulator, TetR n=3 Tax=Mycobacteroides abscessus TaxID=36809 RepID=A0A829HX92_9MYCO|nr:TetR family transcriptional regulator [Mycobacteroides abscessus subsp. massiliense str. GO 06]AWG57233.1 TetR family transcriptional regulator [Mycobacteroides abscessus]EHC01172.1 putative transcriptional regulator TetR [Mycobacteroides abscessus 47J26]EPQ23386.1 hypothetical protein J108_11760 [Mycobacteroides abscessus subsp. bolletii CRM-0020]MBL3734156.1 TetR family transcriptional regulator [Mycobacteroides abscessus subsp. massiliense]SHO95074.1 Putative transcriptional regulator, T
MAARNDIGGSVVCCEIVNRPDRGRTEGGTGPRDRSHNAGKNIRRGQKLGQLPVDIDPDSAGAFVIGGIRHGIAQQLRVTPLPDPGIVTARLWRLISAALGVA